MKNTITGRAAALGLLLLGFFSGCANILTDRASRAEDGTSAAGTGRVLVSIGPRAEGERTLMPPLGDFGSFVYLLTFSSDTATVGPVELTSAGGAVDLKAGTWDLSVTGRLNDTDVLEGYATGIVVTAAAITPVTVTMQEKTGGAGGTLTYSISFPDTVSRGRLGIYGLNNAAVIETVDLLDDVTPDGGTITKAGSLSLAGGQYRLGIDLYTDTGVLSRSDIVHIYPGLTTDTGTEYVEFTAGDFVPAAVDNAQASLAAVLAGIAGLTSGDDKVYLLPAGDEDLAATSVSHAGNVTLTIDGGGRIVTLSGNGSLITVGSGVTLKLKNITLRGRGADVDNDASLIRVEGGNLEMNDGVVITGNRLFASSYADGGGVYVSGSGTFTMSGNALVDAGNDVYLPAGKTINVAGPLTRPVARR